MTDSVSYVLFGDAAPLDATLSACAGMFKALGEKGKASLGVISTASRAAWSSVTRGLSEVAGFVGRVFASIANVLLAPFKALYGVVTGVFGFIKSTITTAFTTIGSVISGTMTFAVNKVKEFARGTYAIIKGLIPLFNVNFFEGLSVGIQEFLATESGVFKVANAVQATGMVAGFTTGQLKDMADQMQELTVYGDDAALAAEAVVLQFKNVRGDIFTGAIKMAADLASATGVDLVGASDKLARALDDPIRGIRVLRSEGIKFSEDEQDMIDMMVKNGQIVKAQQFLLERLAGTFGGAAAAEAKTFGGQIKMLNNQLNDMWKSVAAALVPALQAVLPLIKASSVWTTNAAKAFAGWVTAVVMWAKSSWPVISAWFTGVLELARDVFSKVADWIVQKLGEAFSIGQTIVEHFPTFWDAAKTKIQYYWEALKISLIDSWDWMTNAVSNGWADMLNGMRDSLLDFGAGVASVITNIMVDMSTEMSKHMIAMKVMTGALSKDEGKKQFSALAKGADLAKDMQKKAAKDALGVMLPEAKRSEDQKTVTDEQREKLKGLQASADAAGSAFGEKLESTMTANQSKINKMKQGFKEFLGLNVANPDFEAKDALGAKGKKSGEEFTIEKEEKRSGAFEDLQALQKRISGAASKSPEQQAVLNQTAILKKHHEKAEKQAAAQQEALNKVVKNTDKIFAPDHVGPKFID